MCVCSISLSHASTSHNGIAGPHWGWFVAPSRDPIMPVPLRVATWKWRLTVITAWPSGGEDTLSVSPCRNTWMSLSCFLPTLHLLFSPPDTLPTLLPSLFFHASLHLERKKKRNRSQWDTKTRTRRKIKNGSVDLLRYSLHDLEAMRRESVWFPLMTLGQDWAHCLLIYSLLSAECVFIEYIVLSEPVVSLQKILNIGAVFFLKENHRDRSDLGKVHLYSIPATVFGEFQVIFRINTVKFSLGVNIKGFDVSSHMPVWFSGLPKYAWEVADKRCEL